MKVALVYDRVNKWGGAERVLLSLHKLFPTAPLYTSVYHQKKASWAKVFTVKTSFLQNFPLATSHHELYAWFMPAAFESMDFSGYDLVISVTSESAKNIRVSSRTIHICYCLTPTRYLWSGYKQYFPTIYFRWLSKPFIWYLQYKDLVAARKPDVFIAISKEVKKRIEKYYRRPSLVIYPPVTISNSKQSFIDRSKNKKNKGLTSNYFLVVSRLVPYKRVDIAIKACNKLRVPLKIIGTGSEEKKLRSISGPTVEFLGSLTDKELVEYYKNCRALLFCGREDFGLVIAEAQRQGKPVIAFRGGGAVEIIQENKTGLFFSRQDPAVLIKAIQKFNKKRFNEKTIRQTARKFSQKRFEQEFKKTIKYVMADLLVGKKKNL